MTMEQEKNDERKFIDAKNDEELISLVTEEYADKGLTQEELMEAGRSGIVKAHGHYNEPKEFSFNSYAVWWIRQRIFLELFANVKQSIAVSDRLQRSRVSCGWD